MFRAVDPGPRGHQQCRSPGVCRLHHLAALGEVGHQLGWKALGEVTTAAVPTIILRWRPIVKAVEDLIVPMAQENRSWGYDRIAAALANLGHEVSDQTSARARPLGQKFIWAHLAALAGTDFFTVGDPRVTRIGDLLCSLFIWRAAGLIYCRAHCRPERTVDAANSPKRDRG